MHVGQSSFKREEVKAILAKTIEGLEESPVELNYELRRRYMPLGVADRFVDRNEFDLEISGTLFARPGTVSEKVLRRIGCNSDTQNWRTVRRLVCDWSVDSSGSSPVEYCLVDVFREHQKPKRFQLWISNADPLLEPIKLVDNNNSGKPCFQQTITGWSISKHISDNRPRIANVAKTIIVELCEN